MKLNQGDETLYAFDAFSKTAVLRLAGPGSATVGQPVNVTVTDTQNDIPAANASVHGATTGADGVAAVSFGEEGIYRLKAERADAIRSNALVICADPRPVRHRARPATAAHPSSNGASDPPIPTYRAGGSPGRNGRSRTILVSWGAQRCREWRGALQRRGE